MQSASVRTAVVVKAGAFSRRRVAYRRSRIRALDGRRCRFVGGLAQPEPLDLSGRGLRQLRQELDPPRPLVLGQPLAHELLERVAELGRARDTLTQDNEGHRLDEAIVILVPDDAAFE